MWKLNTAGNSIRRSWLTNSKSCWTCSRSLTLQIEARLDWLTQRFSELSAFSMNSNCVYANLNPKKRTGPWLAACCLNSCSFFRTEKLRFRVSRFCLIRMLTLDLTSWRLRLLYADLGKSLSTSGKREASIWKEWLLPFWDLPSADGIDCIFSRSLVRPMLITKSDLACVRIWWATVALKQRLNCLEIFTNSFTTSKLL